MLMCASNGKEKFENFYPNTYIVLCTLCIIWENMKICGDNDDDDIISRKPCLIGK